MEAQNECQNETQEKNVKRVNFFIPNHISDRIDSLSIHQNLTKASVMQMALAMGLTAMENVMSNQSKKAADSNLDAVSILSEFLKEFKRVSETI